MNKENQDKFNEHHLDFPELFPEYRIPVITGTVEETKKNIGNSIPSSFNRNDSKIKEDITNEDREKKIMLLFSLSKKLENSYNLLTQKYPKKIDLLKLIFENIGEIQISKLHSKEIIIGEILKYIETENLAVLKKYTNELIGNGGNKAGFPPEIGSALFKIQDLCIKLLPHLDLDNRYNAYGIDTSCDLTNAGGGRIR